MTEQTALDGKKILRNFRQKWSNSTRLRPVGGSWATVVKVVSFFDFSARRCGTQRQPSRLLLQFVQHCWKFERTNDLQLFKWVIITWADEGSCVVRIELTATELIPFSFTTFGNLKLDVAAVCQFPK